MGFYIWQLPKFQNRMKVISCNVWVRYNVWCPSSYKSNTASMPMVPTYHKKPHSSQHHHRLARLYLIYMIGPKPPPPTPPLCVCVWGHWWHRLSRTGMSDCIPPNTVRCNYLSMPKILAHGAKVLIWFSVWIFCIILSNIFFCVCVYVLLLLKKIGIRGRGNDWLLRESLLVSRFIVISSKYDTITMIDA